jgi:hypothetical protein
MPGAPWKVNLSGPDLASLLLYKCGYVSSGLLICARISFGYPYKDWPVTPNASLDAIMSCSYYPSTGAKSAASFLPR